MKTQNQGTQLDMKELMMYPLTSGPYSLATLGEGFVKKDKAQRISFPNCQFGTFTTIN